MDPWVGKIPCRMDRLPSPVFMGFPGGLVGEESTCNARDLRSISGLGRSPGGWHGNPLQYSCLENPYGQGSLVGYNPWGSQNGLCQVSGLVGETLKLCLLDGNCSLIKPRVLCPTPTPPQRLN